MIIDAEFPLPEICLLAQIVLAPLLLAVMVFGSERTVLFFERLFGRTE